MLTWKSSRPKVAAVSATGKVIASTRRAGNAVITVTSTFGKKATFKVIVTADSGRRSPGGPVGPPGAPVLHEKREIPKEDRWWRLK